ncbi:MAG: peptide chain release factor N(5)-glutamine methyltransferase [Bacteroidia bacterium]
MDIVKYFDESVLQLQALYPENEAKELMYWLYEDILLIKKVHLLLFSKELSFTEELQLNTLKNRLLSGEPIQYVLGYAYFMDLLIHVNPTVLIPRPETEELVQAVITSYQTWAEPKPTAILDICTGSGCIALALKKALPEPSLFALDISEEAIKTAQYNATQLKLAIQFEPLSVLDEAGINYLQQTDAALWVSNPPYISEAEKAQMHVNVLQYEPHLALFVASDDTILFYRKISQAFCLSPKAQELYFEISEFQVEALTKMANELGLKAAFKKDLQEKWRMLVLKK